MSSKKDNIINSDNYYMGLALAIARENHGLTKENPSVGCVLVKNDQIFLKCHLLYNYAWFGP